MRILEGIFYTNLTIDLTQYIAEIKQKEIIDEYTIFIIFYNRYYGYYKYWKNHDCTLLWIDNQYHIIFYNKKYMYLEPPYNYTINKFKKMCDDYDLLEKYIKFKSGDCYYILFDNIYFEAIYNEEYISFKGKNLSVPDFIEEILTNYPESYKYDYSQIKPVI